MAHLRVCIEGEEGSFSDVEYRDGDKVQDLILEGLKNMGQENPSLWYRGRLYSGGCDDTTIGQVFRFKELSLSRAVVVKE